MFDFAGTAGNSGTKSALIRETLNVNYIWGENIPLTPLFPQKAKKLWTSHAD